MDDDGYTVYKRRNDGRSFIVGKNCVVDNKDVVSYNPYLSYKFNGHINIEVCLYTLSRPLGFSLG